jgi:predicted nuclease of restriction endonuclease-like (RecB) superfamily
MGNRKNKDNLKDGALIPAAKAVELAAGESGVIDEAALFERVAAIIENRKNRAGALANREVTLMYWEVGRYVGSVLLDGERAMYGKRIVATLSQQLSWSHFQDILPLKTDEARMYYARDAAARKLGVHELRRQISRKAYERREIANTELSTDSTVPFNVFKDPYLLDTFALKENFLEADLEKAILADIEAFILEFGHGFAFVERQKRMIVDNEDIVLDKQARSKIGGWYEYTPR